MTRRKMLLMTASATVLGLAALIGFADHNAILVDDDDEGQETLIKLLNPAKINLQQVSPPANKAASRFQPSSRSKTANSSFRSIPRKTASSLRLW